MTRHKISMPNVITLTGPSGCGKSTAVRYFLSYRMSGWSPRVIPKYTTREPRVDDGREIICVDEIPEFCDVVYEQYGVRYGLALQHLFDAVSAGHTAIVIVNDVRAVEDIRLSLGRLVRSLFVFRDSPNFERLDALGKSRGVRDEETMRRRFRKAQAIYRIYIENIYLFDHVLINWSTRQYLRAQVGQVLRGLGRDNIFWPLRER